MVDLIVLSPHLVDAVFSCGGLIERQTAVGRSVLVVTIMAGDPVQKAQTAFVEQLHTRWQLAANAVAMRRQEDIAACRLLGADVLHWDLPDCIYRFDPQTGAPYYVTEEDLFGAIKTADMPLIDAVTARLRLLPAHKLLLCPLGVGNHVDHQIVKTAAGRVFSTIAYYEDYPYVQYNAALECLFATDPGNWQAHVVPLSPVSLTQKGRAIAAYLSQWSTFFTDSVDIQNQINHYAERVGGERLWFRNKVVDRLPLD